MTFWRDLIKPNHDSPIKHAALVWCSNILKQYTNGKAVKVKKPQFLPYFCVKIVQHGKKTGSVRLGYEAAAST